MREALQDIPGKVEEFLGLLLSLTRQGESQCSRVVLPLKLLLKDWPELLKDFAAFLLPEQALECGLVLQSFYRQKSELFK